MSVPVKTSGGGVRSLRTAGSILVFGLVAFSATASEKNQGTCVIAKPVLLSGNASGSATGIEIPAGDSGSESTAISAADKMRSCAPQITRPPDVELDLAASIDPSVTGEPEFALAENCVLAERSFTDRTVEATCPAREVLERVWKITATCGKSAVCIQKISRVDIVAPKIVHCPDDVTVGCNQPTDPASIGMATALDGCDVLPVLSFEDSIALGNSTQQGIITRVWMATDDCGNRSYATQTIAIADTIAPIIESWAADERVDRFESVPPPFHHSVVATDNRDSDIDVKWIRTLDNDAQGCAGDEGSSGTSTRQRTTLAIAAPVPKPSPWPIPPSRFSNRFPKT